MPSKTPNATAKYPCMKSYEGDMQSSLLAEAMSFVTASPEHATHPDPAESAYVFSGHAVATVEPGAEKKPGLASLHADARTVAENFPASPSVQMAAPIALNFPASQGRQRLQVILEEGSAL